VAERSAHNRLVVGSIPTEPRTCDVLSENFSIQEMLEVLLGSEGKRKIRLRRKTNSELFQLYEAQLSLRHRSPEALKEAKRVLFHFGEFLGEFPLSPETAAFYESVSQKYTKDSETFLVFTEENKKNIVQTERVYFGVITDAIEGSYAFNLETDNYTFDIGVKGKAGYSDVLKQAAQIEEKIIKYYTDTAEQSKSLMADVPRTFELLARKRRARIEKLKTLTA
jgi:hypothetical protein